VAFYVINENMNVRVAQDWYGVKYGCLCEWEMGNVVRDELDRPSFFSLLLSLFPEWRWEFWRLESFPVSLWEDKEARVAYVSWIKNFLRIERLEEWYNISLGSLPSGFTLIPSRYASSLYSCLVEAYPNCLWDFWRFESVGLSVWKDRMNLRRFWMCQQTVVVPFDWYDSSKKKVEKSADIKAANVTLSSSIIMAFPEINWDFWEFEDFHSIPCELWKEKNQFHSYFEYIRQREGYFSLYGWYEAQKLKLEEKYSFFPHILKMYENKISSALTDIYPRHSWEIWKFEERDYFNKVENQKKMMKWLEETLPIKSQLDWYQLPAETLKQKKGRYLLEYYSHDMLLLFSSLMPQLKWNFWKMKEASVYWKNSEFQKEYLEHLQKQLYIRVPSDWYKHHVTPYLISLSQNI